MSVNGVPVGAPSGSGGWQPWAPAAPAPDRSLAAPAPQTGGQNHRVQWFILAAGNNPHASIKHGCMRMHGEIIMVLVLRTTLDYFHGLLYSEYKADYLTQVCRRVQVSVR